MTIVDFCENSTFWNNSTKLGASPYFTTCFLITVPRWIPIVWLLLYKLYTLRTCCSRKFEDSDLEQFRIGTISVFKTGICILLFILTGFYLWSTCHYGHGCEISRGIPIDLLINLILNLLVYGSMALVTQLERRKGKKRCWALWIFWLLSVVCSLLIVQNDITFQPGCINSIINYFIFLCICCQFVLYGLAESKSKAGNYTDIDEGNSCPLDDSSILSMLTFSWYTPLVSRCYKEGISLQDLWNQVSTLRANSIIEDILEKWRIEQNKSIKINNLTNNGYKVKHLTANEKTSLYHDVKCAKDNQPIPSLRLFILRNYGPAWLGISFIWLLADLLTLVCPLILREIIQEVQSPDHQGQNWYPVFLAISLFLTTQLMLFFYQHSEQLVLILALKVKTALVGMIFAKCLKCTSSSNGITTGEIMNLVSADCQRIQNSFHYSQQFLSVWFIVGIGLYELYEPVGIAFLGCIGTLLATTGIALFLGKFRTGFFTEVLTLKGKRAKVIDEIVKGIKIIKVYTWESFFTEKVASIRRKEIAKMKKFMRIVCSEITLVYMNSFYMNLVVVLIFSLISSEPYVAERAFVALSIMTAIKAPFMVLPFIVDGVSQLYVSLGRINDFLMSDEYDTQAFGETTDKEIAVCVKNGYFKWDLESQLAILHDINVCFEEGKLTAVVGVVGSGKSSLLSGILGEINKSGGTVQIKGSMAYVPQSAWIQNMTIRDNILYGNEYNERKYRKVIDRCCLKPDLRILPGGDKTEIGERGINVSGGQKQRINLARAVYSDADIYLLDDPLSAVDAHVGKDLFTNIIGRKGMLKKKTRILVTHGVHWLPYVDKVVVMHDGTISEHGTYDELISHDGPFSNFLKQHLHNGDHSDENDERSNRSREEMLENLLKFTTDENTDFTSTDAEIEIQSFNETRNRRKPKRKTRGFSISQESMAVKSLTESQKYNEGKLISEEETQIGSVKLHVFVELFKAMTKTMLILAFVFLCISQSIQIYANFWITIWTTDDVILNATLMSTDEYSNRQTYYILMYFGLIVLAAITLWIFDIFLLTGFVKASAKFHQEMLTAVMRCPMSFFDTTPSGRIINRFSSDIDAVDERFRRFANFLVLQTGNFIGTLIVIVILTPYVIFVIVAVLIIYIVLSKFYLASVRQLKRNEAITRSPLFNHISETFSGKNVIRAYKSQARFTQELYRRLDLNSTFSFAANTGMGWIGLRVESVGNLIILAAALFSVLTPELSGADAGLSLTYALQIIVLMNSLVHSISFLQMEVISIERAQEYTRLQPEADWINEHRPPSGWPHQGTIQFSDYSTRYRPGHDLVLKNITGTINKGEKVGVIGRTGAGKSSLSFALFRLIERAGGTIIIDGIDVAEIGLHDLRSNMSILPQDPIIFSESLRTNLDPKCEFSDNELWNALEYSHLKEYIKKQNEQLDTEFGESGGNLSVGQRQLLCLARTLLHKRKILILDEATAAVDIETDNLIQETIRSQFSECTVLSIAHRINTIMDYDRILVMDQGRIVQFDKPDVLLEEKSGLFFSLAKEAGVLQRNSQE